MLHQQSLSCCTSFAQYGALAAFSDEAKLAAEQMCEELKSRRDYVMKRIGEMDMICVKPEGAFYVFPYFNGADGHKLADGLLEKGVVPGSAFGSQGRGCVRISYGRANIAFASV